MESELRHPPSWSSSRAAVLLHQMARSCQEGRGLGFGQSCSRSRGGGGWGDHGIANDTGPLLLLANDIPAPVSTGHGIAAPIDFLKLPAAPPQWCSTVGRSPTWSAGPYCLQAPPFRFTRSLTVCNFLALNCFTHYIRPPAAAPSDGSQA